LRLAGQMVLGRIGLASQARSGGEKGRIGKSSGRFGTCREWLGSHRGRVTVGWVVRWGELAEPGCAGMSRDFAQVSTCLSTVTASTSVIAIPVVGSVAGVTWFQSAGPPLVPSADRVQGPGVPARLAPAPAVGVPSGGSVSPVVETQLALVATAVARFGLGQHVSFLGIHG